SGDREMIPQHPSDCARGIERHLDHVNIATCDEFGRLAAIDRQWPEAVEESNIDCEIARRSVVVAEMRAKLAVAQVVDAGQDRTHRPRLLRRSWIRRCRRVQFVLNLCT